MDLQGQGFDYLIVTLFKPYSNRLNGTLSIDIHWFKINSRVVRFNKTLLEHWVLNRSNENIHWQFIEKFYAGLPN